MTTPVKRFMLERDAPLIFYRTPLKIVFRPNIFVGLLFQILETRGHVCGLKQAAAAILNRNPNVERGSIYTYNGTT